MQSTINPLWYLQEGNQQPLLATAIHDGHGVREGLRQWMAISDEDRYREEDPYTRLWAQIADSWIVVNRSRFEMDLNRPREKAIYQVPADAWGLTVWEKSLPAAEIALSLAQYDDFYAQVAHMLRRMLRRFGRIVVLDMHSYCHQRGGPDAPYADQKDNPDIIVGTSTMDLDVWQPVVDGFVASLNASKVLGNQLDVRINVKFSGGNFPRWIYATFPGQVAVLSIEVKKIFMHEWTGVVHQPMLDSIGEAIQAASAAALAGLSNIHSINE